MAHTVVHDTRYTIACVQHKEGQGTRFFSFFLFNLTYSRRTSSLPSCLWSLRIFPSFPGSRLTTFLSRCKFSTLTTRQPMVEFYLLYYSLNRVKRVWYRYIASREPPDVPTGLQLNRIYTQRHSIHNTVLSEFSGSPISAADAAP